MDSLTSLANPNTLNNAHQGHQQQHSMVADDLDEIVPMQLDQPPGPNQQAPSSFYTATAPNQSTVAAAQQQQQALQHPPQQSAYFTSPSAAVQQTSSPTILHQQGHHLNPNQQPNSIGHHQSARPVNLQHPSHCQQFVGEQQFGSSQMPSSSEYASPSNLHPQQQFGQFGGGGTGFSRPTNWEHSQQFHHQHPSQYGWQQQQQHHQPLRKESMPALHFNDHAFHSQHQISPQSHHHTHHSPVLNANSGYGAGLDPNGGNGLLNGGGHYGHHPHLSPERHRSMSTAMLPLNCSRSSPSSAPNNMAQQFPHSMGHHQNVGSGGHHSPSAASTFGGPMEYRQMGSLHPDNSEEHRRTKSTVWPPCSGQSGSRTQSAASLVHSLRRFPSQLRSPCRHPSTLLDHHHPSSSLMAPLKPYTPPPILSPMRQGSGLFNRIANANGGQKADRKQSSLAVLITNTNNNTKNTNNNNNNNCHQNNNNNNNLLQQLPINKNKTTALGHPTAMIVGVEEGEGSGGDGKVATLDSAIMMELRQNRRRMKQMMEMDSGFGGDDGEPMMVNGNGGGDGGGHLNGEGGLDEEMAADEEEDIAAGQSTDARKKGRNGGMENGNGIKEEMLEEDDGPIDEMMPSSAASMNLNGNGGDGGRPQRKNGTILFGVDAPSGSGLSFAAELEQLRKQSSASHRSHKASMFCGTGRMSIRHGKLSVGAATDDFIRKMSSVSMEEAAGSASAATTQLGTDCTILVEEAAKVPESDSIPHINLGKNYQARVKKWADRAISAQERAAIPDRDEQLFSANSIGHIPAQALAAFETLACSVALPSPGRNKELALHILAENQGNLQAAVMDLLRCDTLDWEQYPAVYNSRYVDVDSWTPEEINSFQDAIYKSEKDFQQVANELGNRTVHECVAFYYTWKKACPDDYRKLRNLRRKRQLLEQQLDLTSFDQRQPSQSEKSHGGASSEDDGDEEDIDDFSETESDITNPSMLLPMQQQTMECSPAQRKLSMPPATTAIDPLTALLNPNAIHQQNVGSTLFNGGGGTNGNLVGGQQQQSAYPWLHGTDGIFPSPSSSSTSTQNNENGGGGNGIMPAQNGGSIGNVAINGVASLFASQLGSNGGQDVGGLHHHHHHGPDGGENVNGIAGIGGHHQQQQHIFAPKIRHHHGHSAAAKKGAQPQADGFFHCRLCEKRFEKVKSLNAHMKSHAMKARAEAEAQQKQQNAAHLAFPVPTKKEPNPSALASLAAAAAVSAGSPAAETATATNPLAGALATQLGMSHGLQSQAQAAMAALNTLGRLQQQQQQGPPPFGAAGAANFNGLLRNMLQYGQQQQQQGNGNNGGNGGGGTNGNGTGGGGWPPASLEQHFNA